MNFFGLFRNRDAERAKELLDQVAELKRRLDDRDVEIEKLKSDAKLANLRLETMRNDRDQHCMRAKKFWSIMTNMYHQKVGWRAVALHLDPEISRKPDKYRKVYKDAFRKSMESSYNGLETMEAGKND